MDIQEKALDIIAKAVKKSEDSATVTMNREIAAAVAEGYEEQELRRMIYNLATSAWKVFESLPSYGG